MSEVGIRALKQNASAVVSRVAHGETITITDRGRPVAQMTPLPSSPLQGLLDQGAARSPRRRLDELGPPPKGPALSKALDEQRSDERY